MQNSNEKLMDRVMKRVSFTSELNSEKFLETSSHDEVDGSDENHSKFGEASQIGDTDADITNDVKLDSETHSRNCKLLHDLEDAVNKLKTEIENEIQVQGIDDNDYDDSTGNNSVKDETTTAAESRIETFDESESNESNPFVMSSFNSLNPSDINHISTELKEDYVVDCKQTSGVDSVNVIHDEKCDEFDDSLHVSDKKKQCSEIHASTLINSFKIKAKNYSTESNTIDDSFSCFGGQDVYIDNAEDISPKSNPSKYFSPRSDHTESKFNRSELLKENGETIKKYLNKKTRRGLDDSKLKLQKEIMAEDLTDEAAAFDNEDDVDKLPDLTAEICEAPSHESNAISCENATGKEEKGIEKETVVGTKKSRKQYVPKRIKRDADATNSTHSDRDLATGIKAEKSRKQFKPNRIKTYEDINELCVEDDNDADASVGAKTSVKDGEHNSGCETEIVGETMHQDIADIDGKQTPNSQSPSAFFGLPHDLNLYPNALPDQMHHPNTSKHFALDENGPENLEVIRQLREIRCNRYRKISMAEKREISGYASAHGVSQAAAFYNVSKSAVSMWTKLDFSRVDEKSGKSKKNCMIGNGKFEALCKKVKEDRETKFKGMTKQDKFEVSRYAKLVGVREMARCLDVALGTVSGWMRQFPYKVETKLIYGRPNDDSAGDTKALSKTCMEMEYSPVAKSCVLKEDKGAAKKRKSSSTGQRKMNKSNDDLEEISDSYETVQEGDKMHILPTSEEISESDCYKKWRPIKKKPKLDTSISDGDSDLSLQQNDEVDQLIAETLQKPDAAKCFDDVKEMIKDTPLEDDDFFRSLFERVIACRADKYKSLKPSEKLEVVRYAKRVGVRRIAKILGLATGTLSGWNTKFQSSLGLTDPSIDNPVKPDLLVSYLSPNVGVPFEDADNSNLSTAGSVLDNTEKTEVTAVKLLFKENYPVMLKKIEVAKQIKFRNISKDEKIEFVKCSKLVGIRPTARVFGIPIGTLSGWITKYSKTLHPAYHVEGDVNAPGSMPENILGSDENGMSLPLVVGRNPDMNVSLPVLQSGLAANSEWPNVHRMASLASGIPEAGLYTQLPGIRSSDVAFGYGGIDIARLSGSVFQGSDGLIDSNQSEKQLNLDGNARKDPSKGDDHSSTVSMTTEEFDKEAKLMAQKYLKTVYQQIGISNG